MRGFKHAKPENARGEERRISQDVLTLKRSLEEEKAYQEKIVATYEVGRIAIKGALSLISLVYDA